MIDKQALLKVFNQPDEKLLLAKVLDRADLSLRHHQKTFTDFIDPKKTVKIIEAINNIRDLNYSAFGGNDECERRIIAFSPDYIEIGNMEFPIKAIKFESNIKFTEELSHRDYLGSILGLGIDRGKIGDIILFEEYTICFVNEEIADYISINLNKVGRTKVSTEVLDIDEFIMPEKNTVEKATTVASLRFDAVLSSAFNMSRGKVQTLIEGEKASLNWGVVTNTSAMVKEGDMISLRGHGRIKIKEVKGKTRKDRLGIVFCIYI